MRPHAKQLRPPSPPRPLSLSLNPPPLTPPRFHNLEHLADPVGAVLHYLSILKPGGGLGIVSCATPSSLLLLPSLTCLMRRGAMRPARMPPRPRMLLALHPHSTPPRSFTPDANAQRRLHRHPQLRASTNRSCPTGSTPGARTSTRRRGGTAGTPRPRSCANFTRATGRTWPRSRPSTRTVILGFRLTLCCARKACSCPLLSRRRAIRPARRATPPARSSARSARRRGGGFRGVYRDTQLYVAWRLAALKALPKNESLFPYQRDDDAFLVRSSPMPFHHTARIALAQARTMTMLQAT